MSAKTSPAKISSTTRRLNQPDKKLSTPTASVEHFIARHFYLLLALLLVIALVLRGADLRADPPPDLSWSFAPYTDEALNTYSARNLVLYGSWQQDDFLPFCIYPLVNILVALVFKLLGIGFAQVKLISLLAGVLSVLIMVLLIKEQASKTAAILSGLLLATCYPLVMYSRLGLVETVQILFLLSTGLFWVKGLKKPGFMFLSGLFAFATFLLVKISAIFILPALVILFIHQFITGHSQAEKRRRLLVGTSWFLAGAGIAALLWFIVVFLPYHQQYLRYVLRHSSESPAGHPTNLGAYLFNTFTIGLRSQLLPRMIWLTLIGFITLPLQTPGKKPVSLYLLLWLVFGMLMLGYMNYRPPRYEIIILPVLLASAGMSIARLLSPEKTNHHPPQKGRNTIPGNRIHPATVVQAILYAIYLWPLPLQLILYASQFRVYPSPGAETGILIGALGISLTVSVIGFVLTKTRYQGKSIKSPTLRIAVASILLLLSFRLDFGQFFNWFSNRTYNMLSYARDLDHLLPPDAVVAGSWAPPLMIESRKRAVAITDWANINNPFNRFGVTHLIIGENQVDQILKEQIDPLLWEEMKPIREYTVRGQRLKVYPLPLHHKPNDENTH